MTTKSKPTGTGKARPTAGPCPHHIGMTSSNVICTKCNLAMSYDKVLEGIEVYHETGLTPRELKDQNDKLLKAVNELYNHAMRYGGVPKSAGLLWKRVEAAIAAAESKKERE